MKNIQIRKKICKITHFNGIKKTIAIFLINKVYSGTNPRFFQKKAKLLRWYGCKVGRESKIVGPIYINNPIEIGNECWVGKNLQVHGNGKVIIGDRCDIAPDVTILTGSHEIGTTERRAGEGKVLYVSIGNGCWIGARSTILGNTTINDGVVVATCSCVIRNVESNVLVAGVPAKTVRKL